MNKKELVREVAAKSGLTQKDAEQVINALMETLVEQEEVRLVGFGTFYWRETSAKSVHNPQNPSEKIDVPARKNLAFKASKTLREEI